VSGDRGWYRKLHWQIMAGIALGLVYGILGANWGWQGFTSNWVSPWGVLFLNSLKLIAVPLVVFSMVTGIASLSDLKELSRIGGRTLLLFVVTTVIAGVIGLIAVNVIQPGANLPPELQATLEATYREDVATSATSAQSIGQGGPLAPLVQLVPENLVAAASENRNLLQIVFVSLLLGVALIRAPKELADPLLTLFRAAFEVIIQLVHLVMVIAPLGVFALVADTVVAIPGRTPGALWTLLAALGVYALTLAGALVLHTFGVYPLLLRWFSDLKPGHFFSAIAPAQLVAFSTSSSAATLPVTLEVCKEELEVTDEVNSFVVPLGATINMDGTAMFLVVAALFIAQATGTAVALSDQATILLMAVLGSIGAVAVPSIGIVFLISILAAIGAPTAGVALVLSVDRLLDMLRTTTNVTGDAVVASIVTASERRWRGGES
jgi:proton glutamate symport protein